MLLPKSPHAGRGSLSGRLGRERADDAFQETFLKALRAYPKLRHGEHLRAWAYTIAGRVALDELRRKRPYTAPPDWTEAEEDERPGS